GVDVASYRCAGKTRRCRSVTPTRFGTRDPMHRTLSKLLVAVVLSAVHAAAFAIPLTWTLNNVTLSDGGAASSSFAYDPSLNQYSSVSITTTTGSVRTGTTYTFVCTAPCNGVTPTSMEVLNLTASSSSDLTGTPGLALFFPPGMTNLGGTLSLS